VPKSLALLRCSPVVALLAGLLTACHSQPLDEATSSGSAGVSGAEPDQPSGGEGGAANGAAGEPVSLDLLTDALISSDESAANFQRATTSIDFGSATVARATVRVRIESPCFPFSGWAEQGVPENQNWPARCDAFDRTLSLALDEPKSDSDPPALELLRAITPFGGPLTAEADVTDVVNGLPGEHELTLRIDTWSDADGLVSGSQGEWRASVELLLWPGEAPRRVLSVVPLFRGSQTQVEAEPLGFEAPEGANSARIDYLVTGHGAVFSPGCLGPAEEFCMRTHELRVDGELLAELNPWRDCSENCTLVDNDSSFGPARYCAQNPCANPDSARAPRANWCPGNVTLPFGLEASAFVTPGTHELVRTIPRLAPGGTWTVSATYFAFE
jgi:Peptide-N-glycosidase F, C terminal